MGIEIKWTRCGHMLLILLNIVLEDTVETQCWKEWNLCNCIVWNHVIFISCFCDLMMQSPLLILIFPNCLIYKKTSNVRGLSQKRNTSESMLTKQSSVCLCVFLCEYNPFFVELSSCCHPYGGPSCSPPYFLKSPLLTKCCICLPRSDSQVCWHTHCTVSAILNLFPLSHISLLNLFKIFRQLSCLSHCIMVLSKSVYLFFLSPMN